MKELAGYKFFPIPEAQLPNNAKNISGKTQTAKHHNLRFIYPMNRPNQEILVCDWLITSNVTQITGSDWLFTRFGQSMSLP